LKFYHLLAEDSIGKSSRLSRSFKENRMKTSSMLVSLSILFVLLMASPSFAADDGNTKPRLTSAAVFSGTADIINQTSVSGNVKGVSCDYITSAQANLIFTVNGGTAQTIDMSGGIPDANGDRHTGWVPMNIRFTSSVRVQIQYTGSGGQANCAVSWALD
jgi:hypothetical protein